MSDIISLADLVDATIAGRNKIVSENHDNRGMTDCAGLAMIGGKIACVIQGHAWHTYGVRVDRAMNSLEAITLASLADWDLRKVEQYIDWNGEKIQTGGYSIVRVENGQAILLTGNRSVGSHYEIVPIEDLFAFLDALADSITYETAGALGQGERVFITANIPSAEFEIAGNSIEQKIVACSSFDGSQAIQIFHNSFAAVCANTYAAALANRRSGAKGIGLRHTKNVQQRLNEARDALGLVSKVAEGFKTTALAMAETKCDPVPYFDCVLDSVLNTTIAGQTVVKATIGDGSLLNAIADITDSTARLKAESALRRYAVKRDGLLNEILEIYHGPTCQPAGSAWAAFNAVTNVSDHGSICRYNGESAKQDQSRWESNLMGRSDEIKTVAYDLATQSLAV